MRHKLLTAGPDSLADYELLEMVLFLALPRRDTKPIAKALLTRFGSFAAAIAAPLDGFARDRRAGRGRSGSTEDGAGGGAAPGAGRGDGAAGAG